MRAESAQPAKRQGITSVNKSFEINFFIIDSPFLNIIIDFFAFTGVVEYFKNFRTQSEKIGAVSCSSAHDNISTPHTANGSRNLFIFIVLIGLL